MSFIDNMEDTANRPKIYIPNKNVRISNSFQSYIIPKKGWKLHEDYVTNEDNGTVNAVVLIFQEPGKATNLHSQWGVNYINSLVSDVKKHTENITGANKKAERKLNVTFVNNIRVMSSSWIKKYQQNTDNYSDREGENHRESAQIASQQNDLAKIAVELNHSDSYLAVGFKYVVSTTSVDALDDFLKALQDRLKEYIPGTIVALPNGDVEQEFQNLFNDPMKEKGMKTMFTSSEYAGFYNLVTEGIEDDHGVYVGEQIGDINDTAVIWDMTQFSRYAVMGIANRFYRIRDAQNGSVPPQFQNFSGSDMWLNSLILQLAREKQGRVFTLALDPIHESEIMKSVTSKMDMSTGIINPFEMFGDRAHQLSIYQANTEKLNLMARQLASFDIKANNAVQKEPLSQTEIDDLDEILKDFYIDSDMWMDNPKQNLKDLRVVGIEHDGVPTLSEFIGYIKTEYDREANPDTGDAIKASEINRLASVFNRLKTLSSDIFDTHTSPIIDSLGTSRSTLLDYSELAGRQGNILMVQLLNSISAVANQMRPNDVLIIHGAQRIKDMTQDYFNNILENLINRHVRIVFSYTNTSEMLKDAKFNHLTSSDWTLTGFMEADEVAKYNTLLGNQRQMTDNIKRGIQEKANFRYYLRRMQDNIIFDANPYL